MSWRFPPMSPGDLNIDPIEHEFFTTETLGGITDALVREAIQNSLDAAAGDKVVMRFAVGEASEAARRQYLDGLWPHVKAARGTSAAIPNRGEPLRYLAVEDGGTRGLEGDPRQYEDDNEVGRERNDFYYFWRNVGRSRKESTERGRWGLGKTVFAAASRVNAFFGLTTRQSDQRDLLMGQAVLRIHRVDGQRHRPYGYYGTHEGALSLPLSDRAAVGEFRSAFGLRRRGPGLSIVIPFPDQEITREQLLESVLHHYFHPLLSGRLEVEVEHDGARIWLQEQDLESAIRRRGTLRRLLPLIQLARWGLRPEPEAIGRLRAPPAGRAPKLTDDLFDGADLARLRPRFDEGRRIAVDGRIAIEPVGRPPEETEFRLLIERDAEGGRGEGYFVRQGITIENPKARRPRGVRWILVVSDAALSSFLGDAENPAHTEWQRSSPKFKQKYRRGPSTLDFVRAVPANVAALLSRPAEGRDPELLRDIFSLSSDAALHTPRRPEPKAAGTEDTTTEQVIPAEFGKNGVLVLSKVRTGFRLRGRVGEGGARRLEVLAAYEVLRGNPFRRYSPLDFRMDRTIAVQPRGVAVAERRENRLELEIEDAEFELLVTRFDEKRDLRVRVQPLQEPG